jgi:hypothetical protein
MNFRKQPAEAVKPPLRRRGGNDKACRESFLTALLMLAFTLPITATGTTNSLPSTHQAVELGLQFLKKEAFQWRESRKCAACHHAMAMLWTFNEARAAGYAVDANALSEVTAWAFGDMKTNSITEQAPPRDVINLGWVYALLSVETAPEFQKQVSTLPSMDEPNSVLSTNRESIFDARNTLLKQIVKKQVADGSWGHPLDERVPLGGPVEDIAILSRLALLESGDTSSSVTDCIKKSEQWLQANQDKTSHQGRNLRLLMNTWAGRPETEVKGAIAAIYAEQNEDGGWSQTTQMPSDAYATGQALYVLVRAGVPANKPEIKRGAQFLRRTQREEGSWPMTSRVNAKNLTPITAAATAWAVLGLIRAGS